MAMSVHPKLWPRLKYLRDINGSQMMDPNVWFVVQSKITTGWITMKFGADFLCECW